MTAIPNPSLLETVTKLSKLQRDFIVDHVDGMRPFVNEQIDNATKRALLARDLIRFEPRGKLGIPKGTVLTDLGRQALGAILGECADQLTRAHYRVEPPHPELPLRSLEEFVQRGKAAEAAVAQALSARRDA